MILGFIIKKKIGSYDYSFAGMISAMAFLVAAFESLPDEYRRKVGKDVCLYERH
jgi:hypothetical protein